MDFYRNPKTGELICLQLQQLPKCDACGNRYVRPSAEDLLRMCQKGLIKYSE